MLNFVLRNSTHMKKIYLYLLLTATLFAVEHPVGAQNVIPTSDEIVLPKFMSFGFSGSGATKRLPFACRLKLTGLSQNATYFYYTGASTDSALSKTPPGNFFSITDNIGNYGHITGYTSSKGFGGIFLDSNVFNTTSGNNRYSTFTTDANGEYEGYFSVIPTGNAVFTAGNAVYFYIVTNDGAGGTAVSQRFRTSSTIKMLTYGASNASGSTDCSAIRGNSLASGETFVFLYDDTVNTGRPLFGTWAENDGITTTFTCWYSPTVDTTSGAWGAVIPNDNANGVRLIESRDWSGAVLFSHKDDDGAWPSGVNTANPTNDTIPLVIDLYDAPLGNLGAKPTVSFAVTNQSQYENAGSFAVDINIANPNSSATSVDVVVSSGTASGNGSDYTYTTQTVIFPANSSSKQTINIQVTNDNVKENDETIILKLQNVTNAGAIQAGSDYDTLTILNDDSTASGSNPEVGFKVTSQKQNEGAGNFSVDIEISNPNANATSVDVVVVGGTASGIGADYTYSTQTVTFPANSNTKQTVSIQITDDNIKENDETIFLKLQNVTNAGTVKSGFESDTLTIINDDTTSGGSNAPELSFAVTSASQKENAGNFSVDINISKASINATSVDVVVVGGTASGSGVDYNYSTQTVTFPANTTGKQTVSIQVTNDNIKENDETIILQLINPTNAATLKAGFVYDTLTILNDDSAAAPFKPTVTLNQTSSSVLEGNNALIQVNIDSAGTSDITVDAEVTGGTAISGVNYNYTKQTLTFKAGSKLPQTISVSTLSDGKSGDKTLVLTLKNLSSNAYLGANTIYNLTITDDGKLGVNQVADATFELYPNPTCGDINILSAGGTFKICDLGGKQVLSGRINSGNQLISLETIASGVYIVSVETAHGCSVQKLVIK